MASIISTHMKAVAPTTPALQPPGIVIGMANIIHHNATVTTAIATAATYGIGHNSVSSVQFSDAGQHSGYSSISRKVKSHRKHLQGTATAEELQDLDLAV